MDVNLFLLKLLIHKSLKKEEIFDREIERGTKGEYEQRERRLPERDGSPGVRWLTMREIAAREKEVECEPAVSVLLGKRQHIDWITYTCLF
jgi:hypothetical protein